MRFCRSWYIMLLTLFLLPALKGIADDWQQFRGPGATGFRTKAAFYRNGQREVPSCYGKLKT